MYSLHLVNTIQLGKNGTERKYLDFSVSGQSLKKLLDIEGSGLITPFGWGAKPAYEKEVLRQFRLQQKGELSTGRVMIYVCPECGDIDCGAVTAVIKDYGYSIIWKDFGFENGNGVTEVFEHIPPIEFERQAYFQAFAKR